MSAASARFVSGLDGLPAVQMSWPVEAAPCGPEAIGSPTSYVVLALERLNHSYLDFEFS